MKKLAIVTIEINARDMFLENLRYFFEEYVDIESYCVKDQINDVIDADLVAISNYVITGVVKKFIPKDTETVYLNNTFAKEGIEKLRALPEGTKVIMADYSEYLGLATIGSLFELGIQHLDFQLYDSDSIIGEDVIAITPGLPEYVPSGIAKVIDIGWRKIDIATIVAIAFRLSIDDERLNEKILKYAATIASKNLSVASALEDLSKNRSQIQVILEAIDHGIAIVGTEGEILHSNIQICHMLKEREKPGSVKSFIDQFSDTAILEDHIMSLGNSEDDVVVTKRPIRAFSQITAYAIVLKRTAAILEIEHKIRKQSKDKGHIAKYSFKNIISQSQVMQNCVDKAKKISQIEVTTLIIGDTGTGKELFAQSIHNYSQRRNNPFIALNCAALPGDLLESELFGYEEGTFTGAKKGGKKGLFEFAHTGTIFLDEIGDISSNVQVKLLRVLQEKEIMRVGGSDIIPINVRVIAATNRDLEKLVESGSFRRDLYYRLNVFPLYLPPLNDRREDIPLLIESMMTRNNIKNKSIAAPLMEFLMEYPWKGNVRELKNCVEYLIHMGGNLISISDLPAYISNASSAKLMKDPEKLMGELLPEEQKLAFKILEILKYRKAGRRMILKLLQNQEYEISEHTLRKMLNYLNEKDLIMYGSGKSGITLTDLGKQMLKS